MAAAAAAADSVQRIKAEATCSICLGLLRDPLMTKCGHSFCKPCITRICEGGEDATCPQCRQPLPKGSLKPNKKLRSIVALFRPQAEEKPAGWNTCDTHQEPLKLYCNEDQIAICVVCMQSQAHRGHTVVPKEEAVKEYRGKMAEQLGVIESCFGKMHQFVSEIWKQLPENEQEEERQNLARVSEKLRVLQKRTGIPGKRFVDKDSKAKESLPESDSSESDDSEETERQGHSGREPGSEPAAEKQKTTGGPVGEEAPTRKRELSQGSLDPIIHNISGTRGDAEPKVDTQQTENRAEERPSLIPAEGSGGSRTDASSASSEEEGKGTPAGGQAQSAQLDQRKLPPHPLKQPPATAAAVAPDTATAVPTTTTVTTTTTPTAASAAASTTAPTSATHPAGGAAMGGRNEAAREGQQHSGSKISKKKKRKNKKHR